MIRGILSKKDTWDYTITIRQGKSNEFLLIESVSVGVCQYRSKIYLCKKAQGI